jgi:hypothetical protein
VAHVQQHVRGAAVLPGSVAHGAHHVERELCTTPARAALGFRGENAVGGPPLSECAVTRTERRPTDDAAFIRELFTPAWSSL